MFDLDGTTRAASAATNGARSSASPLQDMARMKRHLEHLSEKSIERGTFLMHSNWREWIVQQIASVEFPFSDSRRHAEQFVGERMLFRKHVPKYRTRWQFPSDPHFTFDASDEDWCRYFDIGREVETDQPAIFYVQQPALRFNGIGGLSWV